MSTDHAAKAASLLRALNALGRGEGLLGTTPASRDLMSREALTESVLALNETLNRIFPADRDSAVDAASDFEVSDNGSAEAVALDVFTRPDAYRVDPNDEPSEDMTRGAMIAAEPYRAKGARAVIVDGPNDTRWAVRFDNGRGARVMPVRRTKPVAPPADPSRKHVGVLDLNADDNPCPSEVNPDDWQQVLSAAATARAIGSVGAKSALSTPDGEGVTYQVVFRTKISDDGWKIKSTTPVGDVYLLGPEATS